MIYKILLRLQEPQRSGSPKSMNSKAKLQAIMANPASSTQRVSGKLSISQSIVVYQFDNFMKYLELLNCALS